MSEQNPHIDETITRELKKAIVFLRPDGIVQVNAKDVDEISLEDFKEIVETIGIV